MTRIDVRRGVPSVVAVIALSTGRVSAGSPAAGDPGLRRLVRELGDGTAVGPVMDAVAAVGPDSFWAMLGPLLVGTVAIGLVAFGPVLGLVGLLWVYRRLRWLFWSAFSAVVIGSRRLLSLPQRLAGAETASGVKTGDRVPVPSDDDTEERSSPGDTDVSAD